MTIVLFAAFTILYPIIGAAVYPVYKKLGGHLSFETYMNNL